MRIPFWTARQERRAWQLNAATSVLANAGLQVMTATGISITERKALTYVPVLACSRVLAEDVASLPLITYERLQPRGKERATAHPLYDLLHTQPNPEQDSFMFRSMLQMHAGTWGGGYAEIQTENGWPVALWPIPPWRVQARRTPEGMLFYHIDSPSIDEVGQRQGVDLWASQVFRVFWLTLDGVTPISPVAYSREAIGLGLATQEYGARFFGNDARPGIVLEHPGTLSDTAYKRVQETFEGRHQGLSHSHRSALLEEGMKVHEVGIPPEDAQFLETRKFAVEEIARLYRMPPHKIQSLTNATFSNIEHQGIEYVVDCLRPWLVRWEQAIATQLIPREERRRVFAEFLVDGLLRGDTLSRYQAYAVARQNGWMNGNEIRDKENLNPVEGLDDYLVPLNMVPAETLQDGMSSPQRIEALGSLIRAGYDPGASLEALGLSPIKHLGPLPVTLQGEGSDSGFRSQREERSIAGRKRLATAYHRLFAQAAERIVRREKAEVLKLAETQLRNRNGSSFEDGLTQFYATHEGFIKREMGPVLLSYAEAVHADASGDVRASVALPPELDVFMAAYITAFIARWIGSSRGQILSVTGAALAQAGDPVASLADRMTEWTATRPDKTANRETVRAANAVARETYRLEGIERLVWSASGNACPICMEMDGKTVEITKHFVSAGQSIESDGADEPFTSQVDLGHPPLHDGCVCGVVPG